MDFGASHGQSPEEIEANWQQWYQGAANAAFSTAYTNMYQQTMGPGGIIPVTDGANSDQLFSAMIRAESGGNQFDNNGSPLMSSKGAVGIAQVTEATGPEAAQLAGLSWDRDKWLNDPRYNATIGHAYFQSQMKRYGGDSVLAVAAYNAGHGQVDKWIKQIGDPRKGVISSAEFAAKIPFEETRNYVSKVVGSAPGISQRLDYWINEYSILAGHESSEQICGHGKNCWAIRSFRIQRHALGYRTECRMMFRALSLVSKFLSLLLIENGSHQCRLVPRRKSACNYSNHTNATNKPLPCNRPIKRLCKVTRSRAWRQ